ncbi:MAG TPA: FixH family protein [Acidimicrobiia bacterium]|jgi:copper transport protein
MDRHHTDSPPCRRALRRAAAVLAAACVLVVLLAAPASAHAELVQSDPAPGAVLTRAPGQLTLSYTENVDVASGAIRVFDADGTRIDHGGVEASGRTVTLPLPRLGKGAYVITWRVTSADSHPIRGAFTFQVGQGGAGATSREVRGLADRLLSEQGGDQVVGALYGAARFLVFGGLAFLIGAVFFVVVVWPDARSSRRARRVVQGGWLAVTAGTLVGFLVYGPYVEGLGLGDAFSTGLMGDTLQVRFGQVWLARLVLLLAMVPLLRMAFRRDSDTGSMRPVPRWWASTMAVLAVVLAATPGLSGHAITGDWASAAIFADTIHVLAMALWLGGLVVLAVVTLARDATIEARDAVERFSRLALGCIVALVATGAFQTWRQVGSLDALRTTDYGRILVIKLVLVALVIVFAAFSRELVLRLLPPSHEHGPRTGLPVVSGGFEDDDDEYEIDEQLELRRLRRSVWAEIATAVLILVATALLVNSAPAKTAVANAGEGGVAGVTLRSAKVNVDVTLTPGAAGVNDIHVDLSDKDGAPKDVDEVKVTLEQRDRKIAPIDVPLRRLGPGHYYSPGFDVPIAGEWRVTAKPLLSEFEQPTLRGTLDIG